jgi:uncharacterized protein (TIGR03086 family)
MDGDLLELITTAARATEAVLAHMHAGDASRATPCPEMDVAALASHLIGGIRGMTIVGAGGELRFDPGADPEVDHTVARAQFRAAVDEMVATFAVPGRIDATYAVPWGSSTGAQLLGFALIEIVVHGWDLARGLGCPPGIDEGVAAATLAGARQWVDDSVRVPGMFGPEVHVAAAAPSDALAAFLGRDPAWTPNEVEERS